MTSKLENFKYALSALPPSTLPVKYTTKKLELDNVQPKSSRTEYSVNPTEAEPKASDPPPVPPLEVRRHC